VLPVIIYGLKRKLLRPIIVINLVLLPLLLIVILGNALSSTFDDDSASDTTSGPTVALGVVDEDQTAASGAFVAFFQGRSSAFDVTEYRTERAAAAALSDRDSTVLLTVQQGFGNDVRAQRAAPVALSAVDDNIDALRAAQVAIDSYGVATRASTVAATDTGGAPAGFDVHSYSAAASADARADPSQGVSGITYYAVTMLVLILIYGVSNTMNFVTEEYAGPLGDRYLATPLSRVSLAVGQVVCGVVVTVMQALVVILVARFAFGADYGASLPSFLLIAGVAALFFNCIGLLLGMMARRYPLLDVVVTLAIPAMTFLGGGFVKLDLGVVQSLSVNTLFQNAMFEQISGAGTDWNPLVTCTAVAFVAVLVAVLLLRRPERR
jgi:ABC-2 type transport system permease protein